MPLTLFAKLMLTGLCALTVGCAPTSRAVNQTPALPWQTQQDASKPAAASGRAMAMPPGAQAMSLLGKPLYAPPLLPETRAMREAKLLEAQAEYDRDPHNEEAIIWLGRRLAYLGRYQEAIATFSNGLAIHPGSFRLLRHRGHRYITVRQLDAAIHDLARAAELIQDVPDEIEPDGAPNKLNMPRSTTHTNIFYHLGLAHYLKGDFGRAAAAFASCLDRSGNDDMRVASSYWLYLSLRRNGTNEDLQRAQNILDSIHPAMDVIENHSYHRMCLMFKGNLPPEEAAKPTQSAAQDASIDAATLGYGIGAWRLLRGEHQEARTQFQQIVSQSNWAAFGHIAAEAELSRSAAELKK